MDNTLHTHYFTSECTNLDKLYDTLKQFKEEGKIDYTDIDSDTFKLDDIDLTEEDTLKLITLFEKIDVMPDLDKCDLESEVDDEDFYEDDDEDY